MVFGGIVLVVVMRERGGGSGGGGGLFAWRERVVAGPRRRPTEQINSKVNVCSNVCSASHLHKTRTLDAC